MNVQKKKDRVRLERTCTQGLCFPRCHRSKETIQDVDAGTVGKETNGKKKSEFFFVSFLHFHD
jgi:hypothetical protein